MWEALLLLYLFIFVQQPSSIAHQHFFRLRRTEQVQSKSPASEGAAAPASSIFDIPSAKFHDHFVTNFNKNLAQATGKEGKLNERRVMEGWTATLNRLTLEPVYVSPTDAEIFDQKARAKKQPPPVYLVDARQNRVQIEQQAAEKEQHRKKRAAQLQQQWLANRPDTAPPHPPAKLPFPSYWNGPDPKKPPSPGLIGGHFGPASSLPVGTVPLQAPPMLAGTDGAAPTPPSAASEAAAPAPAG